MRPECAGRDTSTMYKEATMESGYTRHRRGAKYKRPLLRDPWAVRGWDVLAMSILWGLCMASMAAAVLGVI